MINKFKLFVIACLVLTFILSCTKDKSESLKIGVILPLTGELSTMGEVERNAMMLAAEKVNSGSEIIKLIFEDGKGKPNEAVTAANKLVDIEKVDLVITSTSGASNAVEPITTRNNINLIAYCMDPDISKKSEYVLRFYEGLREEADVILNYFTTTEKISKIGVLYVNMPVFEKVLDEIYLPFLKKKNIFIPIIERYSLSDNDFRVQLLKIRDAGIDHLMILGYGFKYERIFNQMVELELHNKLTIIGGWGFLYTTVNPSLLEGVLVAGPEYVFQKQESGDFQKEYLNRFKKYPNFDAAFAYEMIIKLGELFKEKTNFKNPLKKILIEKGELNGVVGKYFFSSDGDMIVKTGLGIYRNGNIFLYK